MEVVSGSQRTQFVLCFKSASDLKQFVSPVLVLRCLRTFKRKVKKVTNEVKFVAKFYLC
jgi:hypothetical protein